MGIVISGLYIDLIPYHRKDGAVSHAVSVVTGTDLFRFFLDDSSVQRLSDFKIGDEIRISARPYVNSHGRLSWTGATLL